MREVLETVAAACTGVNGLQAAIVFGSVLEGRVPQDLDLALLWPGDLPDRERRRRAESIAADIEHRPGGRGLVVDVKDLRQLPLVLQHRVLRDGNVVYVADRRALVRFTSQTVPQALDFLPAYRRMLEASARKLIRVRS